MKLMLFIELLILFVTGPVLFSIWYAKFGTQKSWILVVIFTILMGILSTTIVYKLTTTVEDLGDGAYSTTVEPLWP